MRFAQLVLAPSPAILPRGKSDRRGAKGVGVRFVFPVSAPTFPLIPGRENRRGANERRRGMFRTTRAPPTALTPRVQTRWEPSGRWGATSLLVAFALALAPECKPNGAQAKGGWVLPRTTQPPRSGAQTKWEAVGRRRGMFPNTCVFPRLRPRARAQTESEASRRRRGPFCATYLGPPAFAPVSGRKPKGGKAEGGGVRFVLVVFILARAPKPGRIPNGEESRR